MTEPATRQAALDVWIARETIRCSLETTATATATFDAAVARLMTALGDGVELLGLGEALHGGEELLLLRNRLFQRLVEAHGYSAIAVESSFPRGLLVNAYVAGRGPASYEEVQDAGFSHGFGRLDANRELVEWMRRYNADPSHRIKLQFYGIDMPGLVGGPAGPREVLEFVLAYLGSIDAASAGEHRARVEPLLGDDAAWENQAALADPTQAIGRSPAAMELRIATEELMVELRARRPELVAAADEDRYLEALQHALAARQLLTFHAGVARPSGSDAARLLGIRDVLMADNLAYMVSREWRRGRVFAFAHNAHLQRGKAVLPWYTFWPAGSHLHEMFGERYAVIGSAVGVSDANGIAPPEAGTLEARLTAIPGPIRFIPTHQAEGLSAAELAALPVRSGSVKNQSYTPLTAASVTDFDALVVLDATTYHRGGRPLP
jgi:erythromycin esterase